MLPEGPHGRLGMLAAVVVDLAGFVLSCHAACVIPEVTFRRQARPLGWTSEESATFQTCLDTKVFCRAPFSTRTHALIPRLTLVSAGGAALTRSTAKEANAIKRGATSRVGI